MVGERRSHLRLRTTQQIEGHDVRDHSSGHVDDGDRLHGAHLPHERRKPDLSGVIIVEDEVGRPNEIESDGKQPKERTYPRVSREQGRVTTTTLRCRTNAGLGERAVCSSGSPCRHRSPSPMEYVRDEGG